MCGIYGCISIDAADKVLEGLRKLGVQGIRSAGLAAIFAGDGPVETERTTGYVSDLVSKANGRFHGASDFYRPHKMGHSWRELQITTRTHIVVRMGISP